MALAGYSLALSMARDPITTADKPQPSLTMDGLSLPERLPPHRDARAFAVPAAARSRPSAVSEYRIVLRPPLPELPTSAGIAVFAPHTGSAFDWASISTGSRGADGAITLTVRAPAREAQLSLCAERTLARHGYLARKTVTFDPSVETIEFDAGASTILFVLGDGLKHGGPVHLTRADDPEWQPIAVAHAGLFFESAETRVLLGTGDYELVDPVDPTIRQRFAVPATAPITVESRLVRPRVRLP